MKRYLRFVKKVLGLLTFDNDDSQSPFLTKLKIGTNALKHDVYRFEDIRPKTMSPRDTVNLIKVFAFLNKNGIIILLDLQAYSRFYENYFRDGRVKEFIGKVSRLAKKTGVYILTSEGLLFPNDGRSVVLLRKRSKPSTPFFAIPEFVTGSEFWVGDIDGSNTEYYDFLMIKHPYEIDEESRVIKEMYRTLEKKGIKIYPSIRGYGDFFNIVLPGNVKNMTSWILSHLVPGNYTLEGTEEFQHIVFEDEII